MKALDRRAVACRIALLEARLLHTNLGAGDFNAAQDEIARLRAMLR